MMQNQMSFQKKRPGKNLAGKAQASNISFQPAGSAGVSAGEQVPAFSEEQLSQAMALMSQMLGGGQDENES